MGIKDCVLQFLNEIDAEEFAKWSLGDKYKTILREDWPKFWNERQGDKLKLLPSGSLSVDIPEMIKLWKENEQKTHP